MWCLVLLNKMFIMFEIIVGVPHQFSLFLSQQAIQMKTGGKQFFFRGNTKVTVNNLLALTMF